MTTLELYVDESFSSSESDIVLAGFASTEENWKVFSSLWKERLEQDKLSHFHATKFRNKRSSLFAQLSNSRRAQLLNDLLSLIEEHSLVGVSCLVNQREYRRMTTSEFRSRYGSAYGMAMGGCFFSLFCHLENSSLPYDELSIFVEEGHPHGNGAVELLLYNKQEEQGVDASKLPFPIRVLEAADIEPKSHIGIGAVGFGNKLLAPPLQAADILAYCTLNQGDHWCASVLERITKSVSVLSHDFNRDDIQYFIDSVDADEKARADRREILQTLHRSLARVGIKMVSIPGGFLFDTTHADKKIQRLEVKLPSKAEKLLLIGQERASSEE